MFDRSRKMGRGGAGKRNLHPPPINRTGRPSMGGGAPSSAISSASTGSMQVEESFSLVREKPLNFGMAIKLAPDLVEEIKRVEAQGGGARIKFDVNANNPNGNVIHVGDKVFRFSWSREPGDLCDIYEEPQSEDGNGLLVESGGTWRKLNVERELDESTKNHVKRRSEEAERKHKSRKAIVLDHQTSSMKNQMKAVSASESNSLKNIKNRKEPPFKKAKLNPPTGAPPKPAYISGLSTTTLSKDKISSGSPLSSQPDQHGTPVSPFRTGNLVKGNGNITDVALTQNIIANSDKEMNSRLPHSTLREKSKHKRNTEAKPADLKSLMISLLQEHHPVGMSFKALEKATGDIMPNTARKIEPILKQIAIYQTPGKYILKSEVEKDRLNKPHSQRGSSPEVDRHQTPSPQILPQSSAQVSSFPTRTLPNGEEQGELNSPTLHIMPDITEKIDILQNSSPHQQLIDKKIPNNNEGSTIRSNDSESDSDSDSSSSSSDSESQSRGKSQRLVGSSSNSESDASISRKQASDEEVDIMSDDKCLEESKRSKRKNLSQPVSNRGKPPNIKVTADSGVKLSPQILEAVLSSTPDGLSKKKALDKNTRPPDHIEAGSQHNKVLETRSNGRIADSGSGWARSSEASHGDVSRRMSVNSTEQQHDLIEGVGSQTTNGSKKQKPNVVGDSNGRRIDASLIGSNDGGQNNKDSSSDKNISLYTKYDKEKPELKGPIKDASQQKEYVKEYKEKYEIYHSLKRILDSYRDEFRKFGMDLEASEGRDMKRYHDTLKFMRSSFHQYGEKHKRLKKIFTVVYEEANHLKKMIQDYAASNK